MRPAIQGKTVKMSHEVQPAEDYFNDCKNTYLLLEKIKNLFVYLLCRTFEMRLQTAEKLSTKK